MKERRERLGESKNFNKFTDYGEGGEPVDAIKRKKADELCVQETRQARRGSRNIGYEFKKVK